MSKLSKEVGKNSLPQDTVLSVPQDALLFDDITGSAEELTPSDAMPGIVGRTMFDTPSSDDGTVTVILPRDNIDKVARQSLLRIRSRDDRSYLGTVVKGPFAEPDGLRADTPILVVTTARGGVLLPRYHGRVQVALLGEELADGMVAPPRRRPLPNSPVYIIDTEEAASILRTYGDIRLGLVETYDVEARIPSHKKAVLPRHVGILGTTGGGKSTTVSGLVTQAQKQGLAVVLLDTEGEYTAIHEPTDDPHMVKALERRGMQPEGVKNTHLYHLVGRESTNPSHPSTSKFSLNFAELSPYAVKEIIDLSEAQEIRFFQAYDACKAVLRDLKIYPSTPEEEKESLALDELETGYPRMTLSHLIDIAQACLHLAGKQSEDLTFYNAPFRTAAERIMERVKAIKPQNEVSWRALLSRLWRLHRLKVFDNPRAASPNYTEMIQPGRVSVIDLSDTESNDLRNLVIAQILRGIQHAQEQSYQTAIDNHQEPTPVLLIIEEAHEFLSAQRIKSMPVLFQQVARIARRGRKRWLGLVFVTQLPQHLPDEVLGLINNWILHKIADASIVGRLRHAIGGIDEALWAILPSLAPGQAVFSFTHLSRPLLVSVDPTPCKLLMVQ